MPSPRARLWGNRWVAVALVLPALVAAGVALAWAFRPGGDSVSGELAFVRNRNTIYVVGADGDHLRRLRGSFDHASYDPDWSPDGSRLVFVDNCRLYVMRADGSGAKPLGAAGRYCAQQPSWSPDGLHIAYSAVSAVDVSISAIAVTDTRGSPPRLLSQPSMKSARFDDLYADWSPDGRRIVFARATHTPYGPGSPDPLLFVVNADGSGLRKLAPMPGAEGENMPAWSPDGSQIAFGLVQHGLTRVYVARASGGGFQPLTPKPTSSAMGGGEMGGMMVPGYKWPAWSSDGAKVAFANERGIGLVSAEGSGMSMVTPSRRDDTPKWRPGSSASSAGGMGMDWWPWWITSIVGLLVVAAASAAVFVLERPRVRVAAAVAVVIAAGLAIAAPVVMTSSGAESGGGPTMSPAMMALP